MSEKFANIIFASRKWKFAVKIMFLFENQLK
jgi:hypothetical protein